MSINLYVYNIYMFKTIGFSYTKGNKNYIILKSIIHI